ncbi:MAG: lysophospholipid acyltransferase family protein [Rhodocyclaceae bacterium]|nr:lysophospholipid acyltransferase family protein [Rhodocyclaceae bacterium]
MSWVTFLALIARLFRLLSRLPLGALHRLGWLAGWVTYAASPTYRRRLRANLEQALGAPLPAGALADAVVGAGRQALELPWIWLHDNDAVVARVVRVSGWEHVEAAWAANRGILFLTPHLGCFEISARYYAAHRPITVLYRPPRRAELQPLVEAGRGGDSGIALAPADLGGVRKLMKALRDRQAAGILPDQVPARGEGMWAPFFGRDAYTMTLAARLAGVGNAQLILAWAERLEPGRGYHLHLRLPRRPLSGSIEERVVAINGELEAMIRERPGQYLWGYNRYKRPAGAPPARKNEA